jgi:hypothetical protein
MVLVICGAGGLVLVGLYGLVPGLIATRRLTPQAAIRIDKHLLAKADVTPRTQSTRRQKEVGRPLDPRLAQDLFSEIFVLRSDVANMTQELRSMRERLEELGLFSASGEASAETDATQAA